MRFPRLFLVQVSTRKLVDRYGSAVARDLNHVGTDVTHFNLIPSKAVTIAGLTDDFLWAAIAQLTNDIEVRASAAADIGIVAADGASAFTSRHGFRCGFHCA